MQCEIESKLSFRFLFWHFNIEFWPSKSEMLIYSNFTCPLSPILIDDSFVNAIGFILLFLLFLLNLWGF